MPFWWCLETIIIVLWPVNCLLSMAELHEVEYESICEFAAGISQTTRSESGFNSWA